MNNVAKLDADNSNKYEIKAIWDSNVYYRESKSYFSLSFYFLVLWKCFPREEDIWKPMFAIQHLQKLINTFYKNYWNKPTAILPLINIVLPMVKPTNLLAMKQKCGSLAKASSIKKYTKKNWASESSFEDKKICFSH